MAPFNKITGKEDLISFSLGLCIVAFIIFNLSKNIGEAMGIFGVIIAFGFLPAVAISIPNWLDTKCNMDKLIKSCNDYIADNNVKIGLFVRPALSKKVITLANKYCAVYFNLSNGLTSIKILNKISGIEQQLKQEGSYYDIFVENRCSLYQQGLGLEIFQNVCDIFDYEVQAEKIYKAVKEFFEDAKDLKPQKRENVYLDINKASEAEFTAIPGVSIAKAKRAVKMRKKYSFYLSVNQFYEAINLEEHFIEQIKYTGNKILLKNLPEYQKLEMKEE